MGCDIHTRAEVLVTPQQYNGETRALVALPDEWKMVKDKIFPNDYYSSDMPIEPFRPYGNMPYTNRPYTGRNYELFSVLADVRNENRAGNIFDPTMVYAMRDGLRPIAMPRGVPDDASKGWQKEVREWGDDLHSVSWFTLTELLQAKKDGAFNQPFLNRGYVGVEEYRALKGGEITEPTSWSGWDSRGISEQEYLDKTSADKDSFQGSVATEWMASTRERLAFFADDTIAGLLRLAPFVGLRPDWKTLEASGGLDLRPRLTDHVRLVFGFDN